MGELKIILDSSEVESYITSYNTRRLHSALGYITPEDRLRGRQQQIFKERRVKLEAARTMRRNVLGNRAVLPSRALATSMRSEDQNQGRAQRAAGQP